MKYTLLLSTLLLAACHNDTPATYLIKTDTISAEKAQNPVQTFAVKLSGTWNATVIPAKQGKGKKLVVTGRVNVGNPSAIASLKKQTTPESKLNQLSLILSHEPKDTKERPIRVRYEEQIIPGTKYDTVAVLHNKTVIARIGVVYK